MSEIHLWKLDGKEAWAIYEISGNDSKCLACFTEESEAYDNLPKYRETNPKARVVHFLPAEYIST